ncbi:hypothetical protein POTOM_033586 [Populus tomentosa]|uniref:NmrA-like domain-containing protein n=1 Tax=Populus tomentosa TaxID=118781 RepID=A0A8X8CRL0_POPTO|nr:hypothetical protein POTOM_033586 [Populus tomentosa]
MACKLPTQLATPGKIHHHRKFTARSTTNPLSWRRILSPEPLLSLSTSFPSGKCNVKHHVKCSASGTAEATGAVNLGPGTPVRPTSILVVGATGTLGRQIVRRALDEGYDVRCLVRPRPAPADFLRDWGATVVNVSCFYSRFLLASIDLSNPRLHLRQWLGFIRLLTVLLGVQKSPLKRYVDWEGKVALIQCAKAMEIQKYVFYSIHNCDKHPEVPLMEIKYCTEKFLQDSGLPHVIIRLCGFMQGLIGQYAVPILEEKSVWGTDAPTRIAYMDTQVITLCERLAGQDANVTTVPVSILRFTRQLTGFFEWTNDVADRLAFSEHVKITIVMEDLLKPRHCVACRVWRLISRRPNDNNLRVTRRLRKRLGRILYA